VCFCMICVMACMLVCGCLCMICVVACMLVCVCMCMICVCVCACMYVCVVGVCFFNCLCLCLWTDCVHNKVWSSSSVLLFLPQVSCLALVFILHVLLFFAARTCPLFFDHNVLNFISFGPDLCMYANMCDYKQVFSLRYTDSSAYIKSAYVQFSTISSVDVDRKYAPYLTVY
jgi:GINS complex subunit 2